MSITYKKQFGQHFLIDQEVLNQIDAAIPYTKVSNLLEIGPGGGALTQCLLQAQKNYYFKYLAMEIDHDKIPLLQKNFPEHTQSFILADFLKVDKPFNNQLFGLVGNFPYNISTQIIFKMLEWNNSIPFMVGMFQKEVAQRLASPEGSRQYGMISVVLQALYDVEYLFEIPPTSFEPAPKVDSAVIRCTYNQNKYQIEDFKKFNKFVKIGFQFKRKTLRNNLKGVFSKDILQDEKFSMRAEQWSVAQWVELFNQRNQ